MLIYQLFKELMVICHPLTITNVVLLQLRHKNAKVDIHCNFNSFLHIVEYLKYKRFNICSNLSLADAWRQYQRHNFCPIDVSQQWVWFGEPDNNYWASCHRPEKESSPSIHGMFSLVSPMPWSYEGVIWTNFIILYESWLNVHMYQIVT